MIEAACTRFIVSDCVATFVYRPYLSCQFSPFRYHFDFGYNSTTPGLIYSYNHSLLVFFNPSLIVIFNPPLPICFNPPLPIFFNPPLIKCVLHLLLHISAQLLMIWRLFLLVSCLRSELNTEHLVRSSRCANCSFDHWKQSPAIVILSLRTKLTTFRLLHTALVYLF